MFGLLALALAQAPEAPLAPAASAGLDAAAREVAEPSAAEAEEGAGGDLVAGPDPALPADPAVSAVPLGPERWTPPDAVIAAVRGARDLSIGARVEAASRAFLGLPYLNEAAGEGEGVDPDPPSRYEAFDCLTFVEEVLGLAMAGDPLYAPTIRDAFRYRGPPSYENRRHFMEASWIPDAIHNGLLEDITPRVGHARVLTKDVTADTWRHWRHRWVFHLPDALLPVGSWSLNYLDLAEAAAAVPLIPPGAIVVTLRQDRSYVPIVVTHIGMVVPPAEGSTEVRMRHATRMGRRTVRDDRLSWYVTHLRDYTRWPSLGVTILMPREQGPRRSALQPEALSEPLPFADGPLPTFEPQPIAPFPAPSP